MQIDANTDRSEEQKSDPILAKIIAAKEEDKRPTRKEILAECRVTKTFWAQWDNLKLINGCLYRHWESDDYNTSSKLIVVPSTKRNKS